jgi:hypothetical protein
MNSLISRVEEEDESDHGMRCCWVLSLDELFRANSLECKEQKHAAGRCQEEEATSEPFAQESGQNSPEQVPDCEDTIDEQLIQSKINASVPSRKKDVRCLLGWWGL